MYDGVRYNGKAFADRLLTLGTPHLSLEDYPFGRVAEKRKGEGPMTDESKGSSLQFSNEFCSASALEEEVDIICCCGNLLNGRDGGLVAKSSYRSTCGKEEVDGDGICPLESAQLPGCKPLVVLDKVAHSPGQNKWYGDEDVVALWDELLV